ncbi:unnamed protein product [Hermetia illucens]|uniref:CHK kinase-like domain-containing protein n=1 Tax=Hermetia illucens TaxID=343691 RepID=A0A7R8Z0U7_HERIL|nr:uncharacterized protein LOC119658747 [Hermetia illucens]XP_037922354.1 uncharacterized protein LOC119658747 [Hermetia illucens]XP_037922355.1 uncharacterized protein LOC119658747 [Hermetia illucens]XP_037922356.1 uncharacterized protein LOC119658747 [Hermetia illucens]XP_037922357.1 uncharacterized protein LOC119658747 [Hermetia illucens]XP_037922358.1 uncharacterized protein LOC119658747 [Hermetia illucens]CAD7091896.1 unnamed protein product [Hermetia illucens]
MAGNVVDEGIKLVTEELFHDILEKQFGKCTIKKFTVANTSGAGENYACSLYRITVEVEKEDGTETQVNYIAKMVPPNDPNIQMKRCLVIFPKEAAMYGKVIPKLEEIFQENDIKIIFGPKCWKTVDHLEMLIMEDLGARKFTNADRLNGMDMQHAKAVLSKLAQFHAASACVLEKSDSSAKQLLSSISSEEAFSFFRAIQPMLWGNIVKHLRMWKTCQEYVDRIEGMVNRIGDLFTDVYTPKPDEFNVILHGDLWVNNIMFQHDEKGLPTEVLFVDYQMSRYGSPVQDLMYFILSSTEYSIKVKEFDFMIKYYYRELVKNLKLLKYPKAPPTLIDLHVALVKKCYFGISVSTGVMPMALLDPNENANMENFVKDDETGSQFKQDMYLNPRLIRACESIFPFLENKGAFHV